MSEDKKINDDEKKSGEFRIPPRTWIVWSAIISGVLLLLLFNKERMMESSRQVLSQYEFTQLLNSNLIAKASVSYDVQNPFSNLYQITGKYYKADKEGRQSELPFKAEVYLTEKLKELVFNSDRFEVKKTNTLLMGVLI